MTKSLHLSGLLFCAVGGLSGCGSTQSVAAVTGPAGPPGLIFLGPFDATTHYVSTDVITWQGSAYTALTATTGVAPTGGTSGASGPGVPSPWAILAQAGATGAAGGIGTQGPMGPAGAQGYQGQQGVQGAAGPAGATGRQGVPGSIGPAGVAGPIGLSGVAGSMGPIGPPGTPGAPGGAGQAGANGPAGPSGPTGAAGPPGPPGVSGGGAISPLQGRNLGVQGDSISGFTSYWQNVVIARTGMTLVSQDARPGRAFYNAFECYGSTAPGMPLGSFNPSLPVWGASTCGDWGIAGDVPGNTLAQNIANVDIEVIELGTNDQYDGIGNLGDPVSAGTFYGNVRWVVETYLNAKPTMRIVLVTVQYNSLVDAATAQAYARATAAYGSSIGVPVINMFELGGVNAISAPSLLMSDGIHPGSFALTNFYGPVIAQGLQQIF